MAYPEHVLLAFGGSLHGTEEWTNTLRLQGNANTGISTGDLEDGIDDVVTDLTAFIGTSLFHQNLKLEWVKLNKIGPDGKYADPNNTVRRDLATPVAGTAAAGHPPQVALVATLTTDAQRGLASKGRIFLAGLSSTGFTRTDGLITTTTAADYANGVATLLNNLNNWPGLDAFTEGLDVAVVSKGNASNPGVARKVTGVSVGRVLDTQQRRRRDLVENYTAPVAVS